MALCSYEGCDRKLEGKGLCQLHRRRYVKHGDPGFTSNRNSATPSYTAVHGRLHAHRGKAADHACAVCGMPAREWACQRNKTVAGKAPDGSPVMYSYSIEDYDPMCRPCHREIDAETTRGVRNSRAKLTEEAVREMRSRAEAGEYVSLSLEAKRYGVDRRTVHNALRGETWRHV